MNKNHLNLFKDTYRIESARLPGWNYGSEGWYFVTICTKDREMYFGDVLQDSAGEYSVALSNLGKIVRDELLKTPQIRLNVLLDEWIIMPNHLRVIFVIENSLVETAPSGRLVNSLLDTETPHRGYTETPHRGRLYERGGRHPWHREEWQPNSLGSIVNQFKSMCTKRIRQTFNSKFAWQTRYYDRIIRNERALYAIRRYIKTNPDRWLRDRNNPENILM